MPDLNAMTPSLKETLREEMGELLTRHAERPDLLATWAAEYGADPDGASRFAADVLGVTTLWAKQREFLRLAVTNRLTTAVSANNLGKTFALAVLILFHLFCRGPAVVLTLAPTEAQNKNLWREVRALWLGARVELPGTLLKQGIELSDKHYAVGRATTEAGRLTGLHGTRLLVAMDEAQALEDWTWQAVFQLAGGEQNQVVAIGNGGPKTGKWWSVCESPAWAHVTISALEHPNVIEGREVIPGAVSRQAVEDIAREFGRESGFYAIAVLGLFADDAINQLIQAAWWDAAVARWHARALVADGKLGPLRIGVDVARAGADRTVLMRAERGHVHEIVRLRIPDLALVRSAIEDQLTAWNVRRENMPLALRPGREGVVCVDANALGGGPADELAARGWPVELVWGQGAASEWDAERNRKFVNRRAALAWAVRNALLDGTAAVPPDPELRAEALAHTYSHRADGRILLESKDSLRSRLGRSPDLFDALCYAVGTEADGESAGVGGSEVTF